MTFVAPKETTYFSPKAQEEDPYAGERRFERTPRFCAVGFPAGFRLCKQPQPFARLWLFCTVETRLLRGYFVI